MTNTVRNIVKNTVKRDVKNTVKKSVHSNTVTTCVESNAMQKCVLPRRADSQASRRRDQGRIFRFSIFTISARRLWRRL